MKYFKIAASAILFSFTLNINASVFSDTLLLAINADGDAAYQVANMYLTGNGTSANRKKAIEWLNAASEQGHPKAIQQLAILVLENRKFKILMKLAQVNDIEAQYALADAYTKGIGTSIDLNRAKFWYKKASTLYSEDALQGTHNSDAHLSKENTHTSQRKIIQHNETTSFTSSKIASLRTTSFKERQQAIVLLPASLRLPTNTNNNQPTVRNELVPINKPVQLPNNTQPFLDGNPVIVAEIEDDPTLTNLLKEFADDITVRVDPESVDESNVAPEREDLLVPPMLPRPKISIKTDGKEQISTKNPAFINSTNSVNLGIDYLLGKNWTRQGKPVTYLPSLLTQCQNTNDRIVCNSHIVKEKRIVNTIKYKTKAYITNTDSGGFQITYRNLFLNTISKNQTPGTEITDDDEPGNTNSSQEFKTKSGWTKKHRMECYYFAKDTIRCLKNGLHTIDITLRNY